MGEVQLECWRVFVTPLPGTVRTAGPEVWRSVVEKAVRAPSLYNVQPWRFRVHRGALELRPDLSRTLPVADPLHRQLVISCGAALENVRLELACRDFTPCIELFPDASDPLLLARVRTGRFRPPSLLEQSMRAAIARRRSTRTAMRADAVPLSLVERLQHVAACEGVTLERITDDDRGDVAALVADATRTQGNDPAFRGELAFWLRPNHRQPRRDSPFVDGVPTEAMGIPRSLSRACTLAVREIPWGSLMAARERHLALAAPALVLLCPTGDGTRDWLAAGMSLQRVLLLATARGLGAGFFGQVASIPSVRARLHDRLGLAAVPQMLLRLGVASDAPPTGRRPIDEVLTGAR